MKLLKQIWSNMCYFWVRTVFGVVSAVCKLKD